MRTKTRKASLAEVAVAIEAANPCANGRKGHATADSLMWPTPKVDPEDASHVLGDLDWSYRGIVMLPETIGDLTIDGHLLLCNNELESLPESFGSLTVGGEVELCENPVVLSLDQYPGSYPELG